VIFIKLRDYQVELIEKIKNELRNNKKSIVAVLGCGGGKSVIQANISKNATDKQSQVLFLVHRQELCDQIRETFRK
jgi:superfamily II DNA or RNA helicase